MKIICNIDNTPYPNKDSGKQQANIICNRLKNRNRCFAITPERLAKGITLGYSFTPSAMFGTKSINWNSQQLFIVDIDNNEPDIPLQSIDDCKCILESYNIPYSFIYYTFSHTDKKPKFRIAIISNEVITDRKVAKQMTVAFISMFSQADKSCKDLCRFYYGTNKGLATEVNNSTFNKQILIDLYSKLESDKPNIEPREYKINNLNTGIDLKQAINDFDLLNYVQQTTGLKGFKKGSEVCIKPCPICGHDSENFLINTNKNTFNCFSSGIGGNIINYIANTLNMTISDSRKYFKYKMLGINKSDEVKAWHQQQIKLQGVTSSLQGKYYNVIT